MQLIDFDSHFAEYTRQWMEVHSDDYDDPDDMELEMPAVYQRFLDTPAQWLQGLKPGEYFGQWHDAHTLVKLMENYLDSRVSLPDMLLNRITELGDEAAVSLQGLIDEEDASNEKKMLAISLLRELDSKLPMDRYISWQCQRGDQDELCDNALESLELMGEIVRDKMLEALEGASDAGKEAMLSVLSRYPGDERILEGLLRLIQTRPQRKALLAAYLGRLGDAGALPVLMQVAQQEALGYLDYIELRSAIEALGGEAPVREFYDDAEYEALFGTRDE
ncbi:MAG: hypothetical protein GX781_00655 [Clostridiales bacterium]|nr:hypothetical protein [Clostridiales bacterium]